MRGLTSTIALAAVLLGLVGYIYFVDSKKPASGAAEAKAKAFTVEADQIEEIQFKPASGEGLIWIAAEALVTRELRARALETYGHPPRWVKASGYWVRGAAGVHENF